MKLRLNTPHHPVCGTKERDPSIDAAATPPRGGGEKAAAHVLKLMRKPITLGFTFVFALCIPLSAQWVNIRLPGTPRLPDGKPDLTAPAPRTAGGKPDLSGVWRASTGRYLQNIGADIGELPFQPWAAALWKERSDALGKGRPSERCLPHAIPDNMMVRNSPWKMIQTPGVTILLFEEFNHWRQIFTDGREHPKENTPPWFGYSVGKWEGDTLVVDTIGFND
ncbi:MAG: hypothetical protein HYU27_10810, partial [Acidobacteria bacterium]|nr:hypothetical protein [Acidobacteriota bacterium]